MAQFQNFFATKLYADIGSSDTTITLETAPTVTAGRMVLEARNATQREIIEYTGVSGNQLTGVTRGAGGTSAKSHLKNALVEMNLTADDLQDLYDSFNSFTATVGDGWYPSLASFTSPIYLGNRSYQLTTSIDLTNVISIGMRFSTQRTVAAPTMCTSLNGTTQYWSKSSPSGMTFTDDFVVSAWVKLSRYGTAGTIVSRFNGTSGWLLRIAADGTVRLVGFNAGAANQSYVNTYQSVPLNKWVHITAQLDMSTFTATTTTSYVMLDGVNVPCSVSRAGTNPTALVQAGDFQVGGYNGATEPFPGKIAQVGIFNAKVTQATMRGYISQGLSGTETSLVTAYSFNNSINDLTANANNLTANGAATANNVDSPFTQDASGVPGGTYDYGIVTGINSTTMIVQVPEGCAIPTSGGIAGGRYSLQDVPFGFPLDPAKWSVTVTSTSDVTYNASPVGGTWYNNSGLKITLPIGAWHTRYKGNLTYARTAGGSGATANATLSSTTNSETNTESTSSVGVGVTFSTGGTGTFAPTGQASGEDFISVTTATDYNLLARANQSGTVLVMQGSTVMATTIKAVCAYL